MKNNSSRDYYSTHNHHQRDNYSRLAADRSSNIEKTDRFDRNFDEKCPFYDDRDIDKSLIRVRSSRSPGRGEIRARFDRNKRSRRFYDDDRLDVSRKYMPDNGNDNYMTRGYSESVYLDKGDVRRVSDLHTFDCGRKSGFVWSSLERDGFGRHVSETGDLRSDSEKLGYFHLQNQLLLEKRNGSLRDQDEAGIERWIERGSSKFMEEDPFSLRDSTNFFSSLAQSEDYVSSSSRISRKNLPGGSNARLRGSDLASESVYFDAYGKKREYVSPRRYGDQINDTRSRSRSYLGLPKGKRVDHIYAGKSKIDRGGEEYKEQHTSRMSILDSTVEPSCGKRRSDDDGLWDPRSSSCGRPAPYDGYGSMKLQDFHTDVDGGRVSHNDRYEVLQTREYEPIVRLYDSPRKLGEPSGSERRLVDEHYRDEKFARHVSLTKQDDAPNSSRQNYGQVKGVNKVDLLSLPKKKTLSKYDYEKEERRMPSQRDRSHSSYPVKSGSGNIKRRTGPVPRNRNLSQRVVQKYKKHLRPALLKK